MKVKFFIPLLVLATACNQAVPETEEVAEITIDEAQLFAQAKALFKPLPAEAPHEINKLTPEKIALGKALYYEKRLSKQNNQSCNTCHDLKTYGVDNLATSPGDAGGLGARNSPTVLNAALHFVQFWDGRAKDVEEQAGGPILNPVEMGMSAETEVIDRLKTIPEYKIMFAAAFPDEKEPISYINLQKAIGAFERTLLTPTRWDDYLNGDQNALTSAEKEGLDLFIKVGCITCHTGNNLGGNMYQKFGLVHPYWEHTKSALPDEGRFEVTQNEADKYMFKVPGLRNIEKTYPYFHDGSVATLDEAIKVMAKVQLNKDLTPTEVASIETFLNSLTGTVPTSALATE